MPETLEDIVKRLKLQGMTAIQVHKHIRETFAPVPYVLIRKIFLAS